jgi:hypothetical protein
MADRDTLVTGQSPYGSGGGGGASTVKLVLGGLVVGFGIKYLLDHFMPSSDGSAPPKKDHDNASGKYLAIPGTTVVLGDGTVFKGPARYFNADVARNALRNLAVVYEFVESTQKPIVGDHFVRLARYTGAPDADGVVRAPPGTRAFDWVARASDMGYFVVTPAIAGSGPWSQIEGNNVMIAVKPADMGHDDILDEWAVIAEPKMLVPSSLGTLPTKDLDTFLAGGVA